MTNNSTAVNTTYTITHNPTYNSYEVAFETKPNDAVRLAMKRLGMKWHAEKKLWYGYAKEHQIIDAIQTNSDDSATIYTDGYLGGGAVYGRKSYKYLHGAELSAAIRADIKAAGIKGVTVRVKTYSGGQSITATVKTTAEDYVPIDKFINSYEITPSCYWIWDGERSIHRDEYWSADGDKQLRIRTGAARAEYTKYTTTEQGISHYYIDKYTIFTPDALSRIKKVLDIITAYRYDESNGMVDYYNTNFYYDICTKPI